jgi:hypothetical protein
MSDAGGREETVDATKESDREGRAAAEWHKRAGKSGSSLITWLGHLHPCQYLQYTLMLSLTSLTSLDKNKRLECSCPGDHACPKVIGFVHMWH